MAPTGTTTSSSSTTGTTASSSGAATAAANQDMFLQLLVAQLQNQDPLNPMDGTTFVTQLAQFQQLDTTISTGTDVSSILQDLNTMVGSSSTTGSTNSNTSNTNGTGATTT
jgi:flagellar basal-body rod modification protein FlgD